MKDTRNVRSGFTLIELLVVITIILILAAILLPAITGAIASAHKKKGETTSKAISIAIIEYFAEYSRMPVTGSGDQFKGESGDGSDGDGTIAMLMGEKSSGDAKAKNPKELVFLEAPLDDAGKLRDPWDQGYFFAMDNDFDNKVKYGTSGSVQRKRSIAASRGENGNLEDPTVANSASDDLHSLK